MSSNLVSGYVSSRRKSVFAETYDPEDDDENEEKVRFLALYALLNCKI